MQDIDLDKPIYRFMKYEHLLSIIDKEQLVIAKISKWDDI
jgi:hypothetical protein